MRDENLRCALASPRIVGGNIFFYEGDTFQLVLQLELECEDGEPYVIQKDDEFLLEVFDRLGRRVFGRRFCGIKDGCINVLFDAAAVRQMPVGEYTMTGRIKADYNTTVLQCAVTVEGRSKRL